jgi:hypothetical protein
MWRALARQPPKANHSTKTILKTLPSMRKTKRKAKPL